MQERARSIAIAATFGNLLQGWDNGAIAGALLYIKPEFSLDPALEGLLVASSLLGAWCSTLCSGPAADYLGRKRVLCLSALFYTISSCIMLWSPTVGILMASRFIVGAGIGISVTIVPLYIAEIAPAEIRGQLSTLPQFMGSGGLFVSYVMCFALSLTSSPSWRFMLAFLLVPSIVFFVLTVFYLPESPRWLVSKGKMLDAKEVLQKLRDKPDVAGELALLVEGLSVGGETKLQEWVLEPASDETAAKMSFCSSITGDEKAENITWIAKPSTDQLPTLEPHSLHTLVDPMVTLLGSFHAAAQENFQVQHLVDQVDDNVEVDKQDETEDEVNVDDDHVVGQSDESLTSPLICKPEQQHYPLEVQQNVHVEYRSTSNHSLSSKEGLVSSVGIGGGWQLGWKWEEQETSSEPSLKRVFMMQEASAAQPAGHPTTSFHGDSIQATALVGQAAQSSLDILSVGPVMVHPAETATKGPAWSGIFEGGVRRALVVGVTLQIMQQFSGINAVLYYVPQIVQQSGADVLLAQAGLSSDSASILASGVACFLMLPAIFTAMRLMDYTGRRQMLLITMPLLFISLIIMVVSTTVVPSGLTQAASSFLGVVLYVCTFVMGLGPIPNILGSEIFPTRVRGVCIGICQITFWTCNIMLTNLFPLLLLYLGLAGIFGCFAVIVALAWVFTFLKVPETKGMPLEVITEFFAMSAQTK